MPKNTHANPDIILVWPRHRVGAPPPVEIPAGYAIRTWRDGDAASEARAWIRMHHRAVPSFSTDRLEGWLDHYLTLALPAGIFFAVPDGSDTPVATAGCVHQTRNGMFRFGGQLAWVATDPDHQRRGLATALSATATRRLLDIGYDRIFVITGDDLVPAIRVYLGLGYEPLMYEPDMEQRWRMIMEEIEGPSA